MAVRTTEYKTVYINSFFINCIHCYTVGTLPYLFGLESIENWKVACAGFILRAFESKCLCIQGFLCLLSGFKSLWGSLDLKRWLNWDFASCVMDFLKKWKVHSIEINSIMEAVEVMMEDKLNVYTC